MAGVRPRAGWGGAGGGGGLGGEGRQGTSVRGRPPGCPGAIQSERALFRVPGCRPEPDVGRAVPAIRDILRTSCPVKAGHGPVTARSRLDHGPVTVRRHGAAAGVEVSAAPRDPQRAGNPRAAIDSDETHEQPARRVSAMIYESYMQLSGIIIYESNMKYKWEIVNHLKYRWETATAVCDPLLSDRLGIGRRLGHPSTQTFDSDIVCGRGRCLAGIGPRLGHPSDSDILPTRASFAGTLPSVLGTARQARVLRGSARLPADSVTVDSCHGCHGCHGFHGCHGCHHSCDGRHGRHDDRHDCHGRHGRHGGQPAAPRRRPDVMAGWPEPITGIVCGPSTLP